MESHKLSFKLFAEDGSTLLGHEFVPVFHSWIQQSRITDHLVIDVADYQHVHDGPGTLLISLEANLATDREADRLGLLYVRKQPIPNTESFAERLRTVLRWVVQAASWLEEDPALAGKIKFRTNELQFRIYDRLLAPNTNQTFAAVKDDLEAMIADAWGAPPLTMNFVPGELPLFEVQIKAPSSPKLAELLERLPSPVVV
jgi:hypothetical protein